MTNSQSASLHPQFTPNPLTSTSYSDFIAWRRSLGKRLIKQGESWFEQLKWGVYRATPYLWTCSPEDITNHPFSYSIATVGRVTDEYSEATETVIDVHLLELEEYNLESLPRVSRKSILRAEQKFTFANLSSIADIIRDAYRLYSENLQRSNHKQSAQRELMGFTRFIECVGLMEEHLELLWIGAWDTKGTLQGLICGYLVDKTAYAEYIFVSDECSTGGLGRALYHWLGLSAKSAPGAEELFSGPNWFEQANIQWFKKSVGHKLTPIPVIFRARPGAEYLLRRVLGKKFDRLARKRRLEAS